AFPESIAKAREHWRPSARALELADGVWGHRKRAARAEHARALDGPPEASGVEAERESARAARGGAARALVWGHRQRAARAEHARALDGPPEAFDGLAASLYGWAVDSLAMALATAGGVGRAPVASGTVG